MPSSPGGVARRRRPRCVDALPALLFFLHVPPLYAPLLTHAWPSAGSDASPVFPVAYALLGAFGCTACWIAAVSAWWKSPMAPPASYMPLYLPLGVASLLLPIAAAVNADWLPATALLLVAAVNGVWLSRQDARRGAFTKELLDMFSAALSPHVQLLTALTLVLLAVLAGYSFMWAQLALTVSSWSPAAALIVLALMAASYRTVSTGFLRYPLIYVTAYHCQSWFVAQALQRTDAPIVRARIQRLEEGEVDDGLPPRGVRGISSDDIHVDTSFLESTPLAASGAAAVSTAVAPLAPSVTATPRGSTPTARKARAGSDSADALDAALDAVSTANVGTATAERMPPAGGSSGGNSKLTRAAAAGVATLAVEDSRFAPMSGGVFGDVGAGAGAGSVTDVPSPGSAAAYAQLPPLSICELLVRAWGTSLGSMLLGGVLGMAAPVMWPLRRAARVLVRHGYAHPAATVSRLTPVRSGMSTSALTATRQPVPRLRLSQRVSLALGRLGMRVVRAAEAYLAVSHKYTCHTVATQGQPWLAGARSSWNNFLLRGADGVIEDDMMDRLIMLVGFVAGGLWAVAYLWYHPAGSDDASVRYVMASIMFGLGFSAAMLPFTVLEGFMISLYMLFTQAPEVLAVVHPLVFHRFLRLSELHMLARARGSAATISDDTDGL